MFSPHDDTIHRNSFESNETTFENLSSNNSNDQDEQANVNVLKQFVDLPNIWEESKNYEELDFMNDSLSNIGSYGWNKEGSMSPLLA